MNLERHSLGVPHRLRAPALVATLLMAACSSSAAPTTEAPTTTGPTTEAPTTTGPTTESTTAAATSGTTPATSESTEPPPCDQMVAEEGAAANSSRLTEASGLAASRRHEGVIWTHNDNGRSPAVIALDLDGNELGEFPLPGISGIDIEDLALVDGTMYLGDIGDNLAERDDIAVYRFAEPDPRSGDAIDAVDVIGLTYPERSFDAESLLVDPLTGQLVIIVKTVKIGPAGGASLFSADAAPVFVADPPFDLDAVTELEERGVVALDRLADLATGRAPEGSIADLGFSDVATAADIRGDGATVAVRTYRTVWLFGRGPDQSVAEALGGAPCEAPTTFEQQGEAVAFLDESSNGFVTISEGTNPTINITR